MTVRILPILFLLTAVPALAVAQEKPAPPRSFDPPFDSSTRRMTMPDPTKLPTSGPVPDEPYIKVPVDLAFGAYQRGLYVTAMQEAMNRLKTNSDDAPAMALLGELYRDGLSVDRKSTRLNSSH